MLTIHTAPGFDHALLPVRAQRHKAWWQDNDRTRNHAHHCLPLSMANSLGYYILSPATFIVTWNGDVQREATVEVLDKSDCVTSHAAYGSFTIQPGFIPTTDEVGDFIFVKGVPNERGLPYSCMEALIEGWWSSGQFGLVFLLNQPGRFLVTAGQPIAQMFIFKAAGGLAALTVTGEMPGEHPAWLERRNRPGYNKDLDYLQGRHPDGRQEPTHITTWDVDA